MRALGVAIDMLSSLDAHFKDTLARAQLRQGSLRKLAGTKWGLELGVLKMTDGAVITSLLRYAMVVTGSRLLPDLLRRLNAQIVNIASRRAGGRSRSARIQSLHLAVGASTISHLCANHCAKFVDACLRANKRAINLRLREKLRRYCNVASFAAGDIRIQIPVREITEEKGPPSPPPHWDCTYSVCRSMVARRHLQD